MCIVSNLEYRFSRGRELQTSSITSGGWGTLEAERVGSGRVPFVGHQAGIHHENMARREAYTKKAEDKKIKEKKEKSLENVVGFFLFLTANPMVEPERKKDGDHYGINPTTISDCLYYLSTPPKETLHCVSVTF